MAGDRLTTQLFLAAAPGLCLPTIGLCPTLASTDRLQTHTHPTLTPWKLELHLVIYFWSRRHRKHRLQQLMIYDSYEIASDLCCTASPLFVGSAKALPWQ
jgi:hypothetical protein